MIRIIKVFFSVVFFLFFITQFFTAFATHQEITYEINGHDIGQNPYLWASHDLDYKGERTVGGKEVKGLRIDGTVRSVIVTFRGLKDTNNTPYYLCGLRDQDDCKYSGKKGTQKKFRTNANGEIFVKVCGGGMHSNDGPWLKGTKIKSLTDETPYSGDDHDWIEDKDGCDDKDYFHEGEFYRLGLYQDEEAEAGIITAEFFIKHSYPVVKISPENGSKVFNPLNPINVTLWGTRPGGKNENNYQLVLEGTNNGFKKETCISDGTSPQGITEPKQNPNNLTVGIHSQAVDWKTGAVVAAEHLLNGTGWGGIEGGGTAATKKIANGDNGGIGNSKSAFVLKINERTHDNRPLGIREGCTGGHSYMYIYFRFVKAAPGIEIYKVEYDPNNSDWEDVDEIINEDKKAIPPCLDKTAFTDKGVNECDEIDTAIGPIKTTPEGFIASLFSFVLVLAAFGGVIVIIYSGYLLMISRGDKEKISAARETITSAILGLLFIVFSIVIIEIIGVDILRLPFFGR